MTKFLLWMVFSVLTLLFKPMGAFPSLGLDLGGSRQQRDIHCRDNLEYPNGNTCCLNCPAGTRLISPCTTAGQKGHCEECQYGTYTEHSNNLNQCFKCTLCRSDQETVRPCTYTHDAECRCKAGKFCAPDQPCEVCKRCSRCEEDEQIVRNCTSTTNTECKKIQHKSGSTSARASVIVPLSLSAAVVVVAVVVFALWRRRRGTDSQRNQPDGSKARQHYSDCPTEEGTNGEPRGLNLPRSLVRPKFFVHMWDKHKALCESLSSSASNSQHSLSVLPSCASPAPPPQASSMIPKQPDRREDQQFPKLVPVNGEESLRKSFEYFEEMDINFHKRFFRLIGITDNAINNKEHLPYEDKIHELLNIWMEKEGREANLNDLLKALLDLNQRRTAEIIKEKAVSNSHYFCED
uniref:hematopoietic death receptor isoform X1 n=1 Tax=Scatophagus argus TaxID=75038 RepID=UPI001ED85BBA|nr:hematopoietic death receptor isoform X1 [Scatophagus argus]